MDTGCAQRAAQRHIAPGKSRPLGKSSPLRGERRLQAQQQPPKRKRNSSRT